MTVGISFVLFFSLSGLFASRAAASGDGQAFAGKTQMNGYSLEGYADFEKKWKLVTVRFRRDTNELRFTYANDLAMKTLAAGKKEYPDGAVFAKVGIATADDPLFASSAVPSGARRFQLMVRDAKKHASTGGWGYALFDGNGLTFPEDPAVQSQACSVCHKIAESRGQVFSEIADLRPSVPKPPNPWLRDLAQGIAFDAVPRKSLPASIREKIPARFANVMSLQGPLRVHLFQGTLDEIRPLLARVANKEKTAAVLISENGARYSAVVPTFNLEKCADGSKTGLWMIAFNSSLPNAASPAPPDSEIKFCQVE